ncbi:heme-binding beta-barrel domain-containing protein [Agaribacterium haliotis]|uniref:heme-binding beta-barrel domain-containing protein n=1 Tax=Agaribacterium haliotis TaxID=2013869 RepID=UPI000BB552D9|nr:heme-binding beta-barrel domain-containing protein [Agaribacterium haliotis]
MSEINGIDYGPLAALIGKWYGERGMDIAPERDGPDENPYCDELTFVPSGPAENAEEQALVSLRYHHVVRKKKNGQIFHEQIGHWIYEPATALLMHSLSIPRGVTLLAGGVAEQQGQSWQFKARASADNQDFGIAQSPFMLEKAQTKAFEIEMQLSDNELRYQQITSLFIYGKDFEHKDSSVLTRLIYA